MNVYGAVSPVLYNILIKRKNEKEISEGAINSLIVILPVSCIACTGIEIYKPRKFFSSTNEAWAYMLLF